MALHAVPSFKPTMADYQLEGEMQQLLREYNATKNAFKRRVLWRKYKALHKQRSPAMIAYLEAKKGLS